MTSIARTLAAVALCGALLPACADDREGECDPPCGDSQECCSGACVFTIASASHCGACGNVCTSGACSNGMCAAPIDSGPISDCRPECTANQRCCGIRCVDRSVPSNTDGTANPSFMNCNGCGIACDPERAISCSVPGGGTGPARCMCGDFDTCLAGEVCLEQGGSFGCVSLSTDPNNCGEVGNACADGESCSGGACVCGATGGRCGDGQACCGGSCIDTQTDSENCGGCGMTCTPSAPSCMAGACTCAESGRACMAPSEGFGGGLGESCCPGVGCVTNSDSSCGCGECTGDDECVVGGSGIFGMGGGSEIATVCCGDPLQVLLLGCEGFPLPDGGVGFDGGFPGRDGGPPPSDAGTDAGTDDAGTDDAGADDAGTDAGAAMDAGAAADAGMDAGVAG